MKGIILSLGIPIFSFFQINKPKLLFILIFFVFRFLPKLALQTLTSGWTDFCQLVSLWFLFNKMMDIVLYPYFRNEWNLNLLYNSSRFIHHLSVGTWLCLAPRPGSSATTWNFWIARCRQQPGISNLSPHSRWHPLRRFAVFLSPISAELGNYFHSLFMWKCNVT